MTSIPLHSMPRWRTVAGEQIRAVGLMMRKAGVVLIAVIAVVLAIVIPTAVNSRIRGNTVSRTALLEVTFAPWILLASVVAALFAFAIWRDEDPSRRSYHSMMPVEPRVHTLTKLLAGWVWLLAASTLWLVSIAAIGTLGSLITGHQQSATVIPWWFGLAPLLSATIAYMLVSAAVVGSRQPVVWVVGIILLYAGTLLALDFLAYRDAYAVVRSAVNGEYGIAAALAGDIDRMDTEHLRMAPNVSRWLGASALWGGLGAILLVATVYRRVDPFVVATQGVFRQTISRHRQLVASVIGISVVAGIVATRVIKPEYEARATIWANSRPSGGIAMAVPEQQMSRMMDQIDLLRSSRIIDSVVRQLALYVRPDNAADTSLLKGFSIKDRFLPGDFRIAIDDRGTRWTLSVAEGAMPDSGAVGDSIGSMMGLQWRPAAATMKQYAGREVRFALGTPRGTAEDLQARLTIMQPANSSFMSLSLADPDPHRAARTLNAVANAYVAKSGTLTGAQTSVMDSAVAPLKPFRNSAPQLFGLSLVIGIAATIGLAFAASALDGVRPERIEGSDWLSQYQKELAEAESRSNS